MAGRGAESNNPIRDVLQRREANWDMRKETSLCVLTPPGRKRPHLFYRVEGGAYGGAFKSIAILRVSEREFWAILEKELGIKFRDKEAVE